MQNLYDLNSILNAIDDIHNKPKKIIPLKSNNFKKIKENVTPNAEISPITEKLILEAENYKKMLKNKSSVLSNTIADVLDSPAITEDVLDSPAITEDVLILSNKYEYEEKNIEIVNLDKNEEHLINKEHIINEDNYEEDKSFLINKKKNNLSEDVIKTLLSQESIIKTFEKNEEKLRLKIVDLQQDISLLNNKKANVNNNPALKKKENISEQTTTKTESELIFYKENYERLIIKNNDLKKKLTNSKQQIIGFEQNLKELEGAFEKLNNILSKNSIVKITEPSQNDPLNLGDSMEILQEPKNPTIYSVDIKPKK